jgi:integrase
MQRRQRFIAINPLVSLEQDPVDSKNPPFLPLEEVACLFKTATESDPGLIPALALGFFAGLRTSEIERMEPGFIRIADRQINVPGAVAKRSRQGKTLPRLIDGIPDTVWRWLEAVEVDGEVVPKDFPRRRRDLINKADVQWVHSAARHTFCTYAYAYLADAGKVRKWTGHRNNDRVFLDHYAGLDSKLRGKQYFEILPEGTIYGRTQRAQRREIEWPENKVLRRWTKEMTNVQIAQKLRVSEAAVRKRRLKLKAS